MLDLTSAFGDNLFEVKMLDGTVLHLKRPTQGIQQAVLDLVQQLGTQEGQLAAIPGIANIFVEIINSNTEGIAYTFEDIKDDYSLTIILIVVQQYFEHWNEEINKHVNFHTAQ